MDSRDETTKRLSDLVMRRIDKPGQLCAAEVSVNEGTDAACRVDFMSFRPRKGTDGVIGPSSVELGTFTGYEVKSCMADFRSGHGLNFIGDENYIVCTRELGEQLRGDVPIPDGCNGVLVPDRDWTRLVRMYELHNGRQRAYPASMLLWDMVTCRAQYRVSL